MAEKRGEFTMVNSLVGEVGFSVSGGKPGTDEYIPKTDGFIIRVTYANETEKMKRALDSTRIAVQNTVRQYYRKHKRFPFAPGKVQNVDGNGEFSLPVTVHVDKLEAQAKAGTLDVHDKIRLARAMGLSVPQEWIDAISTGQNGPNGSNETNGTNSTGQNEPDAEYKYSESWLRRQNAAKLRVIAQNEQLEGYSELSQDELVEELMLIEKD